jgi:hypothetical protein
MNRRPPVCYIAAPYSSPDPVANTHSVVQTGLVDDGRVVPLVPHVSLLWHAITPRPIEWWYAHNLHLLARCDAVFRITGPSVGADAEVAEAHRLCIPVFTKTVELFDWAERFRGSQ